MRFVFISDTHNAHQSLNVPAGDVLCHCGDMTISGSIAELEKFSAWFNSLPHKRKYVIAGNHDICCEKMKQASREILSPAVYLEDSWAIHDGVKIYGSPWTPKWGRWSFMREPEDMLRVWQAVPESVDVLLTHGPPRGILDLATRNENAGCAALAQEIERIAPKVHAFGHIHEGYGSLAKNGTTFINCSIMDYNYEPTNLAFEKDVEGRHER